MQDVGEETVCAPLPPPLGPGCSEPSSHHSSVILFRMTCLMTSEGLGQKSPLSFLQQGNVSGFWMIHTENGVGLISFQPPASCPLSNMKLPCELMRLFMEAPQGASTGRDHATWTTLRKHRRTGASSPAPWFWKGKNLTAILQPSGLVRTLSIRRLEHLREPSHPQKMTPASSRTTH